MRSASLPFINPPIIPPIVTIEPNAEYCQKKKKKISKENNFKKNNNE